MPYSPDYIVEMLFGIFLMAIPIALVVWLIVALLGIGRSSPSHHDHLDMRAWDQGREIGRLEQEIADLKRRISDLERHRHPTAGD